MRSWAYDIAPRRAAILLAALASVLSGDFGFPAAESDGERMPPAGEDLPSEPAPPIEELEVLWERLKDVSPMDPGQRELMARTKDAIRTTGQIGPAGGRTLLDYLQRPDTRFPEPPMMAHYVYLEAKVTIIEVLAETGFHEVVPTLIAIVAPAEEVTRQRSHGMAGVDGFSYYQQIAVAAVAALERLGDASAVPTLRGAFAAVWEWNATGAPLFHLLPRTLVALGDEDYLAQYLARHLEGDDPREAFHAALVAQYVPAPLLTPQLIAYFARTRDPAALWALQTTTGQYYVDLASWEEWWAMSASLPPSEWAALEPTKFRQRRWTRAVTALIDEEYLSCGPLQWWQPSRVGYGDWQAAALHLAEIVRALRITEPVSEHLRARLGDQSCASCARPACVACPAPGAMTAGHVSGDRTGPPREPPSPAGFPGSFSVPVWTNAAKLMDAIACVGESRCALWDEWVAIEGILGIDRELDSCTQEYLAAMKGTRGEADASDASGPDVANDTHATGRPRTEHVRALPGAVALLRLAKLGSAVVLIWKPAPNATGYVIQRADDPRWAASTPFARAAGTRFADESALHTPGPLFYIVRGSTTTGEAGP